MSELRETARRAIACLDLTNLDADCDAAAVALLCRRALTPAGPVAAVCVWPAFVSQARTALGETGVRVATVVSFPSGDEPIATVIAATSKALAEGAEEIDLVVPWRALAAGARDAVRDRVRAVKAVCGAAPLKAILETGALAGPALIRAGAEEALDGGADFLKTSTGKVPVNATPEAAEILLTVIRNRGAAAGFKASGGVRSTAEAAVYLGICDAVMGPDWATPARFRFGASSLLDALLATLDGVENRSAGAAY